LIKVNVTSSPRGAAVSVDGEGQGTTPTNLQLPLEREARVRVSMPGYAPLEKQVTASREEPPVRFKLEPLPYELLVRTTPPNAEVNVGNVTAVAPAPLSLGHVMGDVSVSIGKTGYMRMTRPVRLDEFKEQDGVMRAQIEVALSPMPGGVSGQENAAPVPNSPRAPARKPARRHTPSAAPEATPPSAAPEATPSEAKAAPATATTGTLEVKPSAPASETKAAPDETTPSAESAEPGAAPTPPAPPSPPEPADAP
jgi:hypothetical protein